MRPYSQDLRQRIIEAIQANEDPQAEIAQTFGVSLSFVEKLWRRWRTTGDIAPRPHAGGGTRQLKDQVEMLRREVGRQPDVTLEELRERVIAAHGPSVSLATLCRELQRLALPVKKVASRRRARDRAGQTKAPRVAHADG
jgi:transposase